MLKTVIDRSGFRKLLHAAQTGANSKADELAAVPAEISHFALDTLYIRPVQAELVRLLLLPSSDPHFTSCVLVHGMGGTGKTVTAVAVVQQKAIRRTGARVKALQAMLFKQLTGTATESENVQTKSEQDWQRMLVTEIAKKRRALLVLDDPWMPEQARLLNPIDTAHTAHRLLVTTRIRDLVPKARRVELSLMNSDEAVALLLELAGVEEASYLKEPQVVRSWGSGYVGFKEQVGDQSKASTVEERVIGAGLQALDKGVDGTAVKELFYMFAVTQEAMVELLWRACCASESEKQEGSLATRLKVRQWTQMLVDHSLLLGSSDGVHLHDIMLVSALFVQHYIRKRLSAEDLRVLHTQVLNEMVMMSQKRMATTGTGLQYTGSTAKPVDWYCHNVGPYHAMRARDVSVGVTDDAHLKFMMLGEDRVLVEAVAVTVGEDGLQELIEFYTQKGELISWAKVNVFMSTVMSKGREPFEAAALQLLEKSGETSNEAQQLELDILLERGFRMLWEGADTTSLVARIKELLKMNSSLRKEGMTLAMTLYFGDQLFAWGLPPFWDIVEGYEVTSDSILRGYEIITNYYSPLNHESANQSVGARRQAKMMFICGSLTHNSSYVSEERVANVHRSLMDREFGADCSGILEPHRAFDFFRHYQISTQFGTKVNYLLCQEIAFGCVENNGNVPACRELVDMQFRAVRQMLEQSRVQSRSFFETSIWVGHPNRALVDFAAACTDESFRPGVAALLELAGCTTIEDCKRWVKSEDFEQLRNIRLSSADGNHHTYHPKHLDTEVCAVLSLATEEPDNLDATWLDELPEASSSTFLDCGQSVYIHTSNRVLVGEILEGKNRLDEAVTLAQAELKVRASFMFPGVPGPHHRRQHRYGLDLCPVQASMPASSPASMIDRGRDIVLAPFYGNDLSKTMQLIPIIIGEYALAYFSFFTEHDSEEEAQVREYKRVLTMAQMTQALKWDQDQKEEDLDKVLSEQVQDTKEGSKKADEGKETSKGEGKTDEKKTPPSASSLFQMLFDSADEKHITAFGIDESDPWYVRTKALFKERVRSELQEGLANTKKARGLIAYEKDDDVKAIADFSDGRKLNEILELTKDKIIKHFGKEFVDSELLQSAKKFVEEIGATQERGLGILWPMFRPHFWQYSWGLVNMFIDTAFGPALWAQGYSALDGIVAGTLTMPQLRTLCIMYVIKFAWCISLGWPGRAHMKKVETEFTLTVRNEVMRALIRQDTEYFDFHPTGVLQERLGSDASQLSENLFQLPYQFVESSAVCIGEAAMMYQVDPSFLPIVLLPLPFAALVQKYVIKFMTENTEKQRKLSEEAAAATNEIIKEVRTVREFAMEGQMGDRYCANAAHRASIELYGHSMNNCVFMPIFFWIVYILPRFITLYMTGFRVQAGVFTIGKAMQILHGASDMTGNLQRLMNLAPKIPQALIPARRICELLHMKARIEPDPRQPDPRLLRPSEGLEGHIEFRGVDFTYPTEPSKQVLRDLSFTVKPSQKVAFVGSTGCGKSTSIRLIERFYATLAPGTIFVDGVAIEDYDVQYLRQHTSVVAQETVLFSTTIRENIIYGVREEEKAAVTDEIIIAACKKAAAWSFIKEFPAQLETYVGEKGVKLSGGQKQRVAIARAIIREPTILLLDEATSALDSKNEKVVQAALDRLLEENKRGCAIVVAHRLSTIKQCDKIIVMDHGQKVEEGSHDELLKIPIVKKKEEKEGEETEVMVSGWYRDLWQTQMGEEKKAAEEKKGETATKEAEAAVSAAKKELAEVQLQLSQAREALVATKEEAAGSSSASTASPLKGSPAANAKGSPGFFRKSKKQSSAVKSPIQEAFDEVASPPSDIGFRLGIS
eukprot:g112.t1